eukprot:141677_1
MHVKLCADLGAKGATSVVDLGDHLIVPTGRTLLKSTWNSDIVEALPVGLPSTVLPGTQIRCARMLSPSHAVYSLSGSIGIASIEGDRKCCHTSNAPLHVGEITGLDVHPVFSTVATGGEDGQLHISTLQDTASFELLRSTHVGEILTSILWHPWNPNVFSFTTEGGHFQVMDVRESGHELVAHMQSENSSFTCHVYDGEYAVLTGDTSGCVQHLDFRTMMPTFSVRDPDIKTCDFLLLLPDRNSSPSFLFSGKNGIAHWKRSNGVGGAYKKTGYGMVAATAALDPFQRPGVLCGTNAPVGPVFIHSNSIYVLDTHYGILFNLDLGTK